MSCDVGGFCGPILNFLKWHSQNDVPVQYTIIMMRCCCNSIHTCNKGFSFHLLPVKNILQHNLVSFLHSISLLMIVSILSL